MTTMEDVQNLLIYARAIESLKEQIASMEAGFRETKLRLMESGLQLPLEVEYYRTGERYRISDGTHDPITNAVIDMRAGHTMSIAPNWKVEKV